MRGAVNLSRPRGRGDDDDDALITRIQYVDLHTAVTEWCGKFYYQCAICLHKTCGYHYNQVGYQHLGQRVARAIEKALRLPPRSPDATNNETRTTRP